MTEPTRRALAGLLCLCFLSAPLALAADAKASADLTGLWQAKRRFGPDLRGPISITRSGSDWRAEIDGRTADGHASAGSVTCDFGKNRGRVQLTVDSRQFIAYAWWIQPPGDVATPIPLRVFSATEWRGSVTPLEARVTLYLPLAATPVSGSYATFLRNPERNVGVFLNVSRLALDGATVTLYSRRDPKTDEAVLETGRYDRDRDAFSFYLERFDASFDFERVKAGEPSDFYPRGFATANYRYQPPPARDDGWPVSTLEEQGISRAPVEAFIQKIIDTPMDSVHASDIHGVLIARHGRLVLEEYFHGVSRDQLHDTRSAAKSFTSTLAGAVVEQKRPGFGVETPVYAAMQSRVPTGPVEPRKQAIKVEHLLTMSAGFFCDDSNDDAPGNEDKMQEQTAEPDWYRYTLAVPMATAPGTASVYCSSQPNLLGGVIGARTGRPLADLFRELVASPLAMKHYALFLQPTGEPYMGGGVQVEARDFLKFAQLMLNDGTWQGHRILSREWSRRATSPLVKIGSGQYGYLWWLGEYDYHGRKVKAFFAGGNGGQVSLAVPELDLAIAFLGGNYSDRVLFIPQREYVPNDILPAVSEPAR
jgi:CubicO group peptidase (beta-lactamase class C family)